MDRRKLLTVIAGLFSVSLFAQKSKDVPLSILSTLELQPTRTTGKKFYITGFKHNAKENDCTITPIIAYGNDPVNALLNCCSEGGLTVWEADKYEEMKKRSGKSFTDTCKQLAESQTRK